jgi:hypothetical protein
MKKGRREPGDNGKKEGKKVREKGVHRIFSWVLFFMSCFY